MSVFTTIFLGGTVGASRWRKEVVIPGLLARGVPASALFDPVVEHWTQAVQDHEDQLKQDPSCLMLYVLASPEQKQDSTVVSGYSIVEAVMSLYDAPERTVVMFNQSFFSRRTAKGMNKALLDLRKRFPGAPIYDASSDVLDALVACFFGCLDVKGE